MAEFKITRFRYTWKGDWSGSSVTYYKDDVVYHQGSPWVCIRQHTSGVFDDAQTYTAAGDTLPSPAWVKMAEGREWNGQWSSAQVYDLGALVVAGGNLYLCVAAHTSSSNFNSDLIKWEVLATGSNFRNNWAASTRYRVGDIVRYNGYTYQCTLEHTSGTVNEGVPVGNNDSVEDSTAEVWSVVVENYSYVGVYQANTRYRVNDLVKYGGTILKCVVEHTSSSTLNEIISDNFAVYIPGFNYYNDWNSSTFYAIGDVVKKGSSLYIALTNNNNSEPGVSETFDNGNLSNWTLIDSLRYRDWETDRKSTRLNSSHSRASRMPSSA